VDFPQQPIAPALGFLDDRAPLEGADDRMSAAPQKTRSAGAVAGPSWADDIHAVLAASGIRQVALVPDAGHARLIDLCRADKEMRVVPLTTEEEGIALLAGAWLGGEKGVLLMQSSGVGNCINMLSLTKICAFPLLTLVTMRGEWGEFNPWQVPMGRSTPAVLEGAGVITQRVEEAAEVRATVEAAARLAFSGPYAVAVLLSQRLIGAKAFED
jgi:sulfopyruvate decarboxylase alpha subunit